MSADVLLVNLPYAASVGRTQQPDSRLKVLRIDHLAGRSFESFAGEPVGLQYVAGVLRAIGVEARILDAFLEELSMDEVEEEIRRSEAPGVGLAVSNGAESEVLRLIQTSEDAGKQVLIGGPGAPAIRRWPPDALGGARVVVGEATLEKLRPFLRALEFPVPAQAPPGLQRTLDYADVALQQGLSLSIDSSSGCSWGKCSFCYVGASERRSEWRRRPLEDIQADLERLAASHRLSRLTFTDIDPLGARRSWEEFVRLAEYLPAYGVESWMIDCRVDQLDIDLIRHLARLGLGSVFVGVESVDPTIRARYRKPGGDRPVEERIAEVEEAGVDVVPGLILFDPKKTFEQIIRDERWLCTLRHFDIKRRLHSLATKDRVEETRRGADDRADALYDGFGMLYNAAYARIRSRLPDVSDASRASIRGRVEETARALTRAVTKLKDPAAVPARRDLFCSIVSEAFPP